MKIFLKSYLKQKDRKQQQLWKHEHITTKNLIQELSLQFLGQASLDVRKIK